MKPSPATTVAPPEPTSLSVAVIRTAGLLELTGKDPLFAGGAAARAEVVGPVASTVRLIVANGPQLPAASRAWTETTTLEAGAVIEPERLAVGAMWLRVSAVPVPLAPGAP